jgi:hypothetical protein
MGEDTPSDWIQAEDTTSTSEHVSSVTVLEGSQGLNQSHVQEGNKLRGTIQEATINELILPVSDQETTHRPGNNDA